MPSAAASHYRSWRERRGHQRVETEDTNDDHPLQSEELEQSDRESSSHSSSSRPTNNDSLLSENSDDSADIENQRLPLETTSSSDPSSGITVARGDSTRSVSYTHLTLPTKRIV